MRNHPRVTGAEYDLCDLICPISKMRAAEIIDNLGDGETASIIMGDIATLKSVAQELKARGIIPDFKRRDGDRFVITVTR